MTIATQKTTADPLPAFRYCIKLLANLAPNVASLAKTVTPADLAAFKAAAAPLLAISAPPAAVKAPAPSRTAATAPPRAQKPAVDEKTPAAAPAAPGALRPALNTVLRPGMGGRGAFLKNA